jgi:hypothetical protein
MKTGFPAPRSLHAPPVMGRMPRAPTHFLVWQASCVYRKLTNWEKERGQDKAKPDNSAIMQPIAHNLTEAQVKAVAAYLSYLE